MTRHSLVVLVLAATGWWATPVSSRAEPAGTALAKAAVLESNVAYLQVGRVGNHLAEEIRAAQGALAASNQIAGTVLDLRFTGGGDAAEAQAAENVLAGGRLPLCILVNRETHGAAETLAAALRAARKGLVFESVSGPARTNGENIALAHPDITVAIGADDERAFMKDPYAGPATNDTNSPAATNSVLPPVDYTSEADLVRAKIKDGEEETGLPPSRKTRSPKPFIRDPALARAVDLIKGLAIERASHP